MDEAAERAEWAALPFPPNNARMDVPYVSEDKGGGWVRLRCRRTGVECGCPSGEWLAFTSGEAARRVVYRRHLLASAGRGSDGDLPDAHEYGVTKESASGKAVRVCRLSGGDCGWVPLKIWQAWRDDHVWAARWVARNCDGFRPGSS